MVQWILWNRYFKQKTSKVSPTDSFLSLSVLGQLSEAHWLWFRGSSSGGSGGGILVPRIIPPAHFRGEIGHIYAPVNDLELNLGHVS